MRADVPKQYLPLLGQTIVGRTVERLASHPRVDEVVIAVSPDDAYWPDVAATLAVMPRVVAGGAERANSVLNALDAICADGAREDWAMVHDAARPCLQHDDIDNLLDAAAAHDPNGAILAMPVRDTMKRTDAEGRITDTVSREHLWHALTPQVFRAGALRDAIRAAIAAGVNVTDEASAMEWAGAVPRVVSGAADNIKVTQPEDLRLAEAFLRAQGER